MAQCHSVPSAKTQANGQYAQRIDRVIDHSAYETEHAPALEVFLDKESVMDWGTLNWTYACLFGTWQK